VKRIGRILLGCLAGVVIIGLIGLIGINLYLQSEGVQQRIRLATAEALGAPVKVGRTLYTPWTGLVLSGLTVADPAISGRNLAEASRFSVRFEFLPLLQRRFIISEINLKAPHLALRQNERGQWLVEGPKPPPREGAGGGGGGGGGRHEGRPAAESPAYTVELRKFTVREGSAIFTNQKGRPLAKVEGLKIDGVLNASHEAQGEIQIETITIAGCLHPRKLRAHFTGAADRLAISDVRCALAGGEIRAGMTLAAPRRETPRFEFQGTVEGVSVPKLLEEAHGEGEGSNGTLAGRLELRGNPGAAGTITGTGEFGLREAQLKPVEIIRQIGTLLRIDELQLLDLEKAGLRFDVREEKIWINDLTLKTDNVIITATGPVTFRGKLDLDGRLLVNEKIQAQLRGLISENFTASEDAAYKQLTFAVTGRADRPRTDLAEKLVGDYFGGILKGMFKSPRDRRAKEDKPAKPESKAIPGDGSSAESDGRRLGAAGSSG
jgi:uncharacterized protein YhdP